MASDSDDLLRLTYQDGYNKAIEEIGSIYEHQYKEWSTQPQNQKLVDDLLRLNYIIQLLVTRRPR